MIYPRERHIGLLPGWVSTVAKRQQREQFSLPTEVEFKKVESGPPKEAPIQLLVKGPDLDVAATVNSPTATLAPPAAQVVRLVAEDGAITPLPTRGGRRRPTKRR